MLFVMVVNIDDQCCIENSMHNFVVVESGYRQDPAALHWEALSIFLENVMSRAVTLDKPNSATDAGVSLLKRLLLFTSPVSCHQFSAVTVGIKSM